jgi:hypothetical protein
MCEIMTVMPQDETIFSKWDIITAQADAVYAKARIDFLKSKGFLFAESQIKHSYPHCWRSRRPPGRNFAARGGGGGVAQVRSPQKLSDRGFVSFARSGAGSRKRGQL